MTPLFLYGTLRHLPLLAAIVGRMPETAQASLPDFRIFRVRGEAFPAIEPALTGSVPGLLVTDLSAGERSLLDRYEFEPRYRYRRQPVQVLTDQGMVGADSYLPDGNREPDGPWALDQWAEGEGLATVFAAEEYIAGIDPAANADGRGQFDQMLVRGHSRVRAMQHPMPRDLRRGGGGDAVEVLRAARPYSDYFAVLENDLRFGRFDGTPSAPVRRAAFMGGDAVTVLPYDPKRDRVLMIEQFRFGPFARGDGCPWVLEPPAGRIDPGESPEVAARRELFEEAGITATELLPVASYYPSPGAWSEYLYSYVALCDLAKTEPRIGGLDTEDEDILSHVVAFDRAMDLLRNGEVDCAPLVLTLLWLESRRAGLRASA